MSYIVKQSATTPLLFLMIDSSDHISGKTGLTPTVTISKNGAAFASPAGSVAEIGNGWYKLTPTSADTNTLGSLVLHASATGADVNDTVYRITAVDVEDGTAFGLSRIDATISSRATPAQILATPANLLVTDGAGKVALTGTEHALIATSDVTSGLTTQGYTTARAPKLDNLDATISSRMAASSYTVVASAVWDELRSNHTVPNSFGAGVIVQTNNDKTGYALSASEHAAIAVTDVTSGLTTQGYTTTRAPKLDNLDVAVSSRLATSGYTTPPTYSTIASAVWDELRANHVVANSFGAGVIVQTNNDKTGYSLTTLESMALNSGTAQAGAASTITLAAAAASTTDIYKGNLIKVYGGTGSGQVRVITAYNGSTKVATVSRAWALNPDNTSLYAVLSIEDVTKDANLAVTVGTNNDKTGYTLTGSEHALIATSDVTSGLTVQGYTTTRAPKLDNLDGTISSVSGNVWSNPTRALTDKANFTLAASEHALIAVTDVPSGLTTQGYTSARAPKLDNLDGTISSVSGNVWSFSSRTLTDKTGFALTAGEHTQISADVWNVAASSYNLANTMGAKLNSAASATDPWGTTLPGAYGANTAGWILGNRLDVLVSSRQVSGLSLDSSGRVTLTPSEHAAIAVTDVTSGLTTQGFTTARAPKLDNLDGTISSVSGNVWSFSSRSLTDKANFTLAASEHTLISADVWNVAASSYNLANTMGGKLNSAASSTDPWGTVLPGAYSAGTAGYIVGNNLNSSITAIPSSVWQTPTSSMTATGTIGRYLSAEYGFTAKGYVVSGGGTGVTSVTLDSGLQPINNFYTRQTILIVSGAGSGQSRQIQSNTTGRVVSVERAWDVALDTTSQWVIFGTSRAPSLDANGATSLTTWSHTPQTVNSIKTGTTPKIDFFATDTGNGARTGLTWTVAISKNGGAFYTASGSVTEVGSGLYSYQTQAVDTDTTGYLDLICTANTAFIVRVRTRVNTVFDWDNADLGSSIPADVWTNGTRSLTAAVTAGVVNDKTGYSLSASEHALIATTDVTSGLTTQGYTTTRAPKLDNLDGTISAVSGNVWSNPTRTLTGTVTASVVQDKTGYSLSASEHALIATTDVTSGLTVQGYTSARAPKLDNLDGTISSVSGNVWSFASRSLTDKANFTLAASEHTQISADVWNVAASSYNLANTMGAKVNSAASATDPWGTVVPGAYSAGTAGYILGTYLNAAITSRLASGALALDAFGRVAVGTNADKTGYMLTQVEHDTIQTDVASGLTQAGLNADRIGYLDYLDAAISSRLSSLAYQPFYTLSQVASSVWDQPKSQHSIAGTFGYYLDAQVSSASTASSGVGDWSTAERDQIRYALGITGSKSATSGGELQAIKVKTDSLLLDASGRVTLTPSEHALIATTDVTSGLTVQGFTTARAPKLDNLDGTISSVSGNVWTNPTRTLTAAVTAGVVSDKTGYTLAASEHALIATTDVTSGLTTQGYTTTRAPKLDNLDVVVSSRLAASALSVDSSGRVTLTPAEHALHVTDVTSGLTTQGYTVARAPKLDNLDATVSSVSGNVWLNPTRTLTASVTAGVITDKTGYTLASSEHALIATSDVPSGMTTQGYTTTRAPKLDNLDAQVSSIPASTWSYATRTITASVTAALVQDKTGYSLSAGEHALIATSDVPSGLTTQGYTTTRAPKLDNLDTTVSSRLAASAYSSTGGASAIAAAVLSSVVAAPTGAPYAPYTLEKILGWMLAITKFKRTQDVSTETVYADDGVTPIATSTKTDVGNTLTRNEYS